MPKYGVFSGPYFPVFGKYGPGKTPYLDTIHAVFLFKKRSVVPMIGGSGPSSHNKFLTFSFCVIFDS